MDIPSLPGPIAVVRYGVAPDGPITVVLADDNPHMHELVERILGPEFRIIGEALDGEELIELADRLMPDVVVVDVSMPKLGGIEAVRRLHTWRPPAIVFLTSYGDADTISQAQAAGARGFVVKQHAAEDLVAAIHAALREEIYTSPSLIGPRENRAQAPGYSQCAE